MTELSNQPQLELVGGSEAPKPSETKAPTPSPTPAPAQQVVQWYPIPDEVDEVMTVILSWPRPHDTTAEKAFCGWLRSYLADDLGQQIKEHAEGAFSVTIPRADGRPSSVLFSCHVDTVDLDADGCLGVVKKLVYDANFGHICLDNGPDAPRFSCLGGDDGVGIWIMLTMIGRKKEGTYLFHRGEECGGVSSKAIARTDGEWLKQFDYAVAFDRPRDNEVITHQGGVRCASDKAAAALCAALKGEGLAFAPSDRGVYTDTKEYRGVISECFNLGVGYESQHTSAETVDYAFCTALAGAAIAIDWDSLPAERTPEITLPPRWNGYTHRASGRWSGWDDEPSEVERELERLGMYGSSKGEVLPRKSTPAPAPAARKVTPTQTTTTHLIEWIKTADLEDIIHECQGFPDETADILVGLVRENHRLQADNEYLAMLVDRMVYGGDDAH